MKFVRYLPLLLVCFLTACGEPSKSALLSEIEKSEYAAKYPFDRSMLSSTVILLKEGRQVDRSQLNEALIFATKIDARTVIKFLIDRGADVNVKDEKGFTPLMDATRRGHLDVVQFLIEKGADVNAKDKYGFTALVWAALGGHLDVVQFLVEKGANVNTKDEFGFTVLSFAKEEKHSEIVEFLRAHGAKE